MSSSYDDSRFTYDAPQLTYQGAFLPVTLTGAQPSGAGDCASMAIVHRLLDGAQPPAVGTAQGARQVFLEGFQPIVSALHYNSPDTVYDDPRYIYEWGPPGYLTWRVSYHRSFTGTQPYPSGTTRWAKPVKLTGFQPIFDELVYDDADAIYDDLRFTYEWGPPGRLTWRRLAHYILTGEQPPSGDPESGVVWIWNPYIWAQYTSLIDPDYVTYIASFEADPTLLYHSTVRPERDTVYVFKGPQVYTRRRLTP